MLLTLIKELIDSYFGIGSVYNDALSTPTIKRETLAFYLYMTVGNRDLRQFNLSLDVLCTYLDQQQILPVTRNNILRALKLLNDLRFNHPIKTPDDNVMPAREFYFARYPHLDIMHSSFEVQLQRYLITFVTFIIQGQLKLQVRFTDWCLSELPNLNLEPTTSWRLALKLPADQCPATLTDTQTLILPGSRRVRFSEGVSLPSVPFLNVSPSSYVSTSTQSLPTIQRGRPQCTG